MIQDVRCCYMGNMGELGDMEIRDAYKKLCDNGVLREEYKIVERKGLNHALDFPQVFKTEWIQIFLSCIHDNYIWLEGGPMKINKRIINQVSGYPTLDRPKSMRSDAKETIEKNIGVVWNKRGMSIGIILDPLIAFAVRLIAHKLFQFS